MVYFNRKIEKNIKDALKRGKSILLLGPRQVGKTTLINETFNPQISLQFARAKIRLRYEKDITLFEKELEYEIEKHKQKPLIFIDEVQKIPAVMDTVQSLVDEGQAQFILTGSSARKLKIASRINLLPGRVVQLAMPPLIYEEFPDPKPHLEDFLLWGSLPGIVTLKEDEEKETDLYSYVSGYLEEEIRAEAAVRNLGHFSRFLEIAAGESGKQLNFAKISQEIGVAHNTIANYYQILEDTLIAYRIDPVSDSRTKRRLIKSPKYFFFDLGVRRACANEGVRLPVSVMADLFEHYVGIELIHQSLLLSSQYKIRYWRDSAGPEVDFVLDYLNNLTPIEVKWSEAPKMKDARHLLKFLNEYPAAEKGYIICRTPKPYRVHERILALPWQQLSTIFD